MLEQYIEEAKRRVEESWNIDDGRTWESHKIKTKDFRPITVHEFRNGKGTILCTLSGIVAIDYKGEVVYHSNYRHLKDSKTHENEKTI